MTVRLINPEGKLLVLPGFNHKIGIADGIKSADQAGDTSATDRSHLGFKPATVNVRLQIRAQDASEVERLNALFHATKNDRPVVYRILHPTANAWGVDKATFADDIRLQRDRQRKLHEVSLTMRQVESIPDMKEKRADPPPQSVPVPSETARPVSADATNAADTLSAADLVDGGWVEQFLAKANQFAKETFFS